MSRRDKKDFEEGLPYEKVRIPRIGERIKFFDDGKAGYSRRYWAKVTNIYPWYTVMLTRFEVYYAWKKSVKQCPWLYNKKTDYFIVCDIKRYDSHPVIFVRTVDGRWFSIDYPNDWMSGLLDVDDKKWNEIRESLETDIFLEEGDERNLED